MVPERHLIKVVLRNKVVLWRFSGPPQRPLRFLSLITRQLGSKIFVRHRALTVIGQQKASNLCYGFRAKLLKALRGEVAERLNAAVC